MSLRTLRNKTNTERHASVGDGLVGDGARGEEGGAEGVGGCGGAVPGVGDPALDGGALVLHPPAQIEGGLGVRHGGVVCLSGVGIRDGMGGAAGWSSKWILILFFSAAASVPDGLPSPVWAVFG